LSVLIVLIVMTSVFIVMATIAVMLHFAKQPFAETHDVISLK